MPANLHTETLDGVIQVSEEDAYEFTVRCAREEGILVGPSSGAALAAVAQKLTDIPEGSTVLTFCYDTGERYFSVGPVGDVEREHGSGPGGEQPGEHRGQDGHRVSQCRCSAAARPSPGRRRATPTVPGSGQGRPDRAGMQTRRGPRRRRR